MDVIPGVRVSTVRFMVSMVRDRDRVRFTTVRVSRVRLGLGLVAGLMTANNSPSLRLCFY